MTTETQNVGSHIGLIDFGGRQVPIGFIASFRKKNCRQCESTRGFCVMLQGGKRVHQLCGCAVTRAIRALKSMAGDAFEGAGQDWLAKERERIAKVQEICRQEGYDSTGGIGNPYEKDTDQNLAWQEGRDKKMFEDFANAQAKNLKNLEVVTKAGYDSEKDVPNIYEKDSDVWKAWEKGRWLKYGVPGNKSQEEFKRGFDASLEAGNPYEEGSESAKNWLDGHRSRLGLEAAQGTTEATG